MPEINEVCTFETKADQVRFITKTNGDSIRMDGLKLTQEQATSLAWLVNSGDDVVLKFKVKVKE